MRRTVCLYVVGTPPESIRAELGTYEDWFGRLFGDHEVDVVAHDGTSGTPPPDWMSYAGYVITGSAASMTIPEPWMEAGVELIRGAFTRGIPLLGVCFGHQLMGAAFGGSVVANPEGWEISTHGVDVTEDDPLFDGLPRRIEVNLSHRDVVDAETLSPMNGVRVLAGNARTDAQAIAAGPHLRGVQFHPEFDGRTTAAYIRERFDTLAEDAASRGADGDHPEQLLAGARDCPHAETVFHNFVKHFVMRVDN